MAREKKKVRYAVVGLGNIAQVAVLPAFKHASEKCELGALISSDPQKLKTLGKEYGVEHLGGYDEMERLFEDAAIDAAYIALPNAHHRAFTERCARARVHVLCEKPMAMNVADCEAMMHVCDENDVKLMIAYRLHFDAANLRAIESVREGKLGNLRFFSSTFGQRVRADDIRTQQDLGGGALFDMGIYCINAARNLFRAEPEEVMAMQSDAGGRFFGVDATTTALLRFPGDRFAQLVASQDSGSVDEFRIVGTKGDLRVEPAFTYYGELTHHRTVDEKTKKVTFSKSDQFAPELLHFAECIDEDREPEPSGEEGLADVRILEAIAESAQSHRSVRLLPYERSVRPTRELERHKPPVKKPKLVHAPSPSK